MSEQDEVHGTEPDPKPVVPPGGSFLGTLNAVAWSFFGVRKNSDYQKDLARLNPLHIIAVAMVMVAVMVLGLIVVVNWVVAR